MIVRISRARIKPNSEAAAFQILREGSDAFGRPPGLEALFISRRMAATGNELVAISVWADLDATTAVLTDDWQRPRFLPTLDPLFGEASVEHYETVVENFDELKTIGA